jgi:hypothetical protein
MQKLGMRPHSFISGNICFEFSVQCVYITLEPFQFFLQKFKKIFAAQGAAVGNMLLLSLLTTGVFDKGIKFAAGNTDTGRQLAAGVVVDTLSYFANMQNN